MITHETEKMTKKNFNAAKKQRLIALNIVTRYAMFENHEHLSFMPHLSS